MARIEVGAAAGVVRWVLVGVALLGLAGCRAQIPEVAPGHRYLFDLLADSSCDACDMTVPHAGGSFPPISTVAYAVRPQTAAVYDWPSLGRSCAILSGESARQGYGVLISCNSADQQPHEFFGSLYTRGEFTSVRLDSGVGFLSPAKPDSGGHRVDFDFPPGLGMMLEVSSDSEPIYVDLMIDGIRDTGRIWYPLATGTRGETEHVGVIPFGVMVGQ